MRLIKRAAPALAALAATSTLVFAPTSAHATTAPVTIFDEVTASGSAPTTNVLSNDHVDPSTTLTLTSVTAIPDPNSGTTGDPATVMFTADGQVTVDFDMAALPSGRRYATGTFRYAVTDGFGQQATGQLFATEVDPTLVAVDDSLVRGGIAPSTEPPSLNDAFLITDGASLDNQFNVTANDTWPGPGYSKVVLVGSASSGTITNSTGNLVFTPPAVTDADFVGSYQPYQGYPEITREYTAAAKVTFGYELCLSDVSHCSATATASFRFSVVREHRPATAASTPATFWEGDTTHSVTFSRRAEALKAKSTGVAPFDPSAISGAEPHGDHTCSGDPLDDSVTITEAEAQAAAATSTTAAADTLWCANGVEVAETYAQVPFVALPAAPTAKPDEVWTTVGQQVPLRINLNDGFATQDAWLANGVDVSASRQPYSVLLAKAPEIGTVTSAATESTVSEGTRAMGVHDLLFESNVEGTAHLSYRACNGWPTAASCSAVTDVLVHVSPNVEARNDSITFASGSHVVPVLSNDTFSDPGKAVLQGISAPTPAKAVISLGQIPAGLRATVNPDRTVSVSGTPGTYRVPETLVDWTGRSHSVLSVTITKVAAPLPAPIARDDIASGYADQPIHVNAIGNDSYAGGPHVRLLDGPAGVSAHVDPLSQDVVVTIPARLAGQRLHLHYRLTADLDRGSDDATITVIAMPRAVTGMPVDPAATGPIEGPTGHSNLTLLGGGLAGLGLLTGAGLLGAHRRRRAAS